MKINVNDPVQESKILDGLESMHRRNDPQYAEAYDWYMQTYRPTPPVSYPTASPVYPSVDSVAPTWMDAVGDFGSSIAQYIPIVGGMAASDGGG